VGVVVVLALVGACMPMQGSGYGSETATKPQLLKRASFDLRCPQAKLDVTFLNTQTAAVVGCGVRATYVERCQTSPSFGGGVRRHDCIWILNNTSTLVNSRNTTKAH
jgi:hypothetical protein